MPCAVVRTKSSFLARMCNPRRSCPYRSSINLREKNRIEVHDSMIGPSNKHERTYIRLHRERSWYSSWSHEFIHRSCFPSPFLWLGDLGRCTPLGHECIREPYFPPTNPSIVNRISDHFCRHEFQGWKHFFLLESGGESPKQKRSLAICLTHAKRRFLDLGNRNMISSLTSRGKKTYSLSHAIST